MIDCNTFVHNCNECPFCNKSREYGDDGCNLDKTIVAETELPSNGVHERCPLKKFDYLISLAL